MVNSVHWTFKAIFVTNDKPMETWEFMNCIMEAMACQRYLSFPLCPSQLICRHPSYCLSALCLDSVEFKSCFRSCFLAHERCWVQPTCSLLTAYIAFVTMLSKFILSWHHCLKWYMGRLSVTTSVLMRWIDVCFRALGIDLAWIDCGKGKCYFKLNFSMIPCKHFDTTKWVPAEFSWFQGSITE